MILVSRAMPHDNALVTHPVISTDRRISVTPGMIAKMKLFSSGLYDDGAGDASVSSP